MTGLQLLINELEKNNYKIGETDTSKGESNGNFIIYNPMGNITTQNYKRLSELYGTLTFYHFSPEEAISEIIKMIEISFNTK